MTTTPTSPGMEVSDFEFVESQRDLAYRRLAAVMLRLDVKTLAADLRARRLGRELVSIAITQKAA